MNVRQLEIGQVLLRASEVAHHRTHEQLILFLETVMDTFEVALKLVQVRRHLPCVRLERTCSYLERSLGGSQAGA